MNDIDGTWQVPRGLRAMKLDLSEGWIYRGIECLVRTQNEDGSSTEYEITGTGFPKAFYLKHDMHRTAWPLRAMATHRHLLQGQEAGAML